MTSWNRGGLVAAVALVAANAAAADPSAPYGAAARVSHIEGVLTALGHATAAELTEGSDFARALARGACAGGAERLRVECLTVAVRRYCHDRTGEVAQRCPLAMDILVSRILAEEQLIPLEKRYQIIRENRDYRAALAHEIHRLEGTLAVDFHLRAGVPATTNDAKTLAPAIDRYCLASTDETKLSYPTCVSSLVWFLRGPQ